MKQNSVRLLAILIAVAFILPFGLAGTASASHATCIEGAEEQYCGVTMDWMNLFGQVEGPFGNLDSDENAQYRSYYQGIGKALNESIEDTVTGESLPEEEADEWWQGRAYESPIGYPEYRYELHFWNENSDGTANCRWVSDNEEENEYGKSSYLKIQENAQGCGTNNQSGVETNEYEGSWTPNSDFDFGDDKKGSLNRFKVDTVSADVYVPEDSKITINLYPTGDREDRIGQAVFDGEEIRTISSSGTSRRTADLSMERYNRSYYTSIQMERASGEDAPSPKFGGEALFVRSYPPYRVSSLPFASHPTEDIETLNTQMYSNFDQNYFTGSQDRSTSTSPRIEEYHFENASATENDDHFQSSDNVIFHHGYIEVADVQPSTLVANLNSNSYYDSQGSSNDDYDLDGNWNRLIDENGLVPVVYDVAVESVPQDNNNYSTSAVDSDLRWSYSYKDTDYELEFGYQQPIDPRFPSEFEVNADKTVIETVERENPGVYVFYYDDSDYVDSDLSRFYAEMNAEVTYDISYDEKVIEYSDCPNDDNNSKAGYQLPDTASSDASSCSSSTQDYVDEEYWDSLDSAPTGFDSSATYSLEALEERAEDTSEYLSTPDNNEFDEDDFRYKQAYSQGKDRAYFERNVEDNSLEETRWTDITGTGISERKSVYIQDNNQTNTSIRVPRVSPVSDTGLSTPTQSQSYEYTDSNDNINTESPNVNFAIPGYVEDDSTVTIDIFVAGPYEGFSTMDVEVEGKEVTTVELFNSYGSDTRERYGPKVTGIDITDEVHGEGEIDVNFTYNNDEEIERDIRIDYVVNIDTNQQLSKIQSRWSYATFRNSKWDVAYEFQEDCNGADRCYNYSNHSIPIADDKINNGDSRGFAEDGPPSNITWYYPSGAYPVQSYLIPSTDTLLTQRSGQSNEVRPAIPRDDNSLSAVGESIANLFSNDEAYLVAGEVKTPLESEYCAKAPVPNSDDDEWRNYCDLYDGYLASEQVESDILDEQSDNQIQSQDIADVKRNLDKELRELEERDSRGRRYDSPVNFSGKVEHSDYRPLRNDTDRTFFNLVKFEVLLANDASSWDISGNATWHDEDLGEPKAEYILDDTNLNIEHIMDPEESIPEEKRDELRSEDVEHEFITDSSPDEAIQLKVTLQDSNDYPVSIEERESLYGTEDTKYIEIENTEQSSNGNSWLNNTYSTNQDGVVYVTAKPPESYDEELRGYYAGNEYDWWTHDSQKRLLMDSSASLTVESDADDNDGQAGIDGVLGILIAGMFILGGFLTVLSWVFRTNPHVNTGVTELVKLMFEPFSGAVSRFVIYIISLLLLTFVFLLMSSTFLGSAVNPFDAIFGQIIF